MYTVVVEGGFSATHQLRLADGSVEPLHGHDWRVRAYFTRADLDGTGMVIDFEEARRLLHDVTAGLAYRHLNDHDLFRGLNPTAEVVARTIFSELQRRGAAALSAVSVEEAPGCVAVFGQVPMPRPQL